nr:hypothetical protein [Butyrivibrio sp.]
MANSPQTDRIKLHIYELIFFIYFGVMFGARAVGLYEGQTLYNLCLVLGVGFFGLKVLTTKHSALEYIAMAALLLLSLLVYKNTGEKGLLLYFTMMLSMKGIRDARPIRLGLTILSISYTVLFILSMTGIINEMNHMVKRSGFGYILRHSLGYPYPNTTHTTFLILLMLFFYLYKAKTFRDLFVASLIAMLINIYLFMYTISFTGLISVTAYLILNLYFYTRKKLSSAEGILITAFYPLILAFSILGPILAKGEAFEFLNKVLHKRYEYALYFLQNERITAFGSRFGETPTNWYMLDNSFLYLFLQLGVIPFIVVSLLYFFWIISLVRENKGREIAIMLTFYLIGMSDPFLYNLSYKNITFIFVGAWLFRLLEKSEDKLPGFLSKKIQVLGFGEKEIELPIPYWGKLSTIPARIAEEIHKNKLRYFIVFVFCVILGSGIYTLTVKKPSVLYIDEKAADPYDTKKKLVYLTADDVQNIIDQGDIIEDYRDAETPMYAFKKNAATAEYARGILSSGLLLGVFSIILLSIKGTHKKK